MNAPNDPRPGRLRTIRLSTILITVVVVAAIGVIVTRDTTTAPGLSDAGGSTTFTYDYVIPGGTQNRIDAGETVEIVPAELIVTVGESIRIVNEDDTNHVVGTFFVPAGTTLQQHFGSPGELVGECDVHPSGKFRLLVKPAK